MKIKVLLIGKRFAASQHCRIKFHKLKMKVVRISAIFLVLMTVGVQQGKPLLSDIWTVIKYGYSFSSKLLEGGSAYDLITDDSSEKLDAIYSKVKDMMKEQRELSNRLEENVQTMMNNLAADLKNDQQFNTLRTKLTNDYIGRIRTAFQDIHSASERNYTDQTVFGIANQLTSYGPHEIRDNLGSIKQLVSDGGSSYFSNFIDVMLTRAELQKNNRCGKGWSLQQEIYQLYELLASTEQLAYTTLSYAYTIKSKQTNVNFTNEINGAHTDMVDRTRQYMRIIKKAMAKVSTEIHRCEPAEYIRNENFIELERLNQLVLLPEDETSLNRGCSEQCHWYKPSDGRVIASDISGLNGILGRNCIKCASTGKTSICYPKNNTGSHRYFGIKTNLNTYKADTVFGDMKECYENREGVYPLKEYTTHIASINSKCDICLCTCVNHEIDLKFRYSLSLTAELSDISKNMVVTGIKFYKRYTPRTGQVIYPQIKVGKLWPGGTVNTTYWKKPEVDIFYIPKEKPRNDFVVFGRNADEVNFVNIDDAVARPNHVITGVKFLYWDDMYRVRRPWHWVDDYFDNGKSVSLVVRMTRCNFTTAQLFPHSSDFGHPNYDLSLYTDDPLSPRQELWLEDADIPTKSKKIKPVDVSHSYTRFTISDKIKDVGQSTFPFIDIQPVETSPPAPLSGVGLFAKNEDGYGGFLAFRIMTLNMTNVINDGVPVPEPTVIHPDEHISDGLLPEELLAKQ